MTAAASNITDDGDFFQVQPPRNRGNKKRVYVGNLPSSPNNDIKSKLVDFINEKANLDVVEADVTVLRQGSAALVSCQDVQKAISVLNNVYFQGNALTVQRERKKRPAKITRKPIGGGGWNRPAPSKEILPETTAPETKETAKEVTSVTKEQESQVFVNELELSQHIGSIIADELEAAQKDPSNCDVVNTMIASTAAMTLLSSTDAFNLEQSDKAAKEDAFRREQAQTTTTTTTTSVSENDFMAQSKKPLSELLADYGEQDLDFHKVIPIEETPVEPPPEKEKKREDYNNRLTLAGKAPIHVEVTSFGYMHGVPTDLRGWSHAHPLAPVDCRDLPQVPPYLARQDGLSPAVKRVLLNARDETDESKRRVKECADQVGELIFDALCEAISSGGHGHVSPLRMSVFVGSETGRHRSVVVCELAATALRKLLRANKDNRITQPVSVGTRHRDIERRQQQRETERRPTKQSKQAEFESEW